MFKINPEGMILFIEQFFNQINNPERVTPIEVGSKAVIMLISYTNRCKYF